MVETQNAPTHGRTDTSETQKAPYTDVRGEDTSIGILPLSVTPESRSGRPGL